MSGGNGGPEKNGEDARGVVNGSRHCLLMIWNNVLKKMCDTCIWCRLAEVDGCIQWRRS